MMIYQSLKPCDFFLLAVPIIVWAKYKCWIYVYLEKVFDYSSASNDSKLKFIAYVYMCGERERERENIGCFTVTIVDETVTNFAVIHTVVNTGSGN